MFVADPELTPALSRLHKMNFVTIGHCAHVHNGLTTIDHLSSTVWIGPFISIADLTEKEQLLLVDAAKSYSQPPISIALESYNENYSGSWYSTYHMLTTKLNAEPTSELMLKACNRLTDVVMAWGRALSVAGLYRPRTDNTIKQLTSSTNAIVYSWLCREDGGNIYEN